MVVVVVKVVGGTVRIAFATSVRRVTRAHVHTHTPTHTHTHTRTHTYTHAHNTKRIYTATYTLGWERQQTKR